MALYRNPLFFRYYFSSAAGEITDIDVVDEKVEATGTLRSTESLKRSMLVFYRQTRGILLTDNRGLKGEIRDNHFMYA
eukprot:1387818-Amorphochlora_amoeboformis.AAC.1